MSTARITKRGPLANSENEQQICRMLIQHFEPEETDTEPLPVVEMHENDHDEVSAEFVAAVTVVLLGSLTSKALVNRIFFWRSRVHTFIIPRSGAFFDRVMDARSCSGTRKVLSSTHTMHLMNLLQIAAEGACKQLKAARLVNIEPHNPNGARLECVDTFRLTFDLS